LLQICTRRLNQISNANAGKIKEKLALAAGDAHRIVSFETEYCFNVQTAHALDEQQQRVLRWLLRETFEPQNFGSTSFLKV
jgi:hypothetical protein